MTQSKSPRFFYGYIIVAAAFAILLVAGGLWYSFGVFFKPLLAEFDWTRATLSGAYSLFLLTYALLSIVMGSLNDRFGPRMVVTIFGSLCGLGLLLMSKVSDIWQLYLFYGVIFGVGMAGIYVPLLSTVARWFVKKRGLMTGITLAGMGVGAVIIPPLASRLISSHGWQNSYIIFGIVVLAVVISAAQFLRRDPSQVGQLPYGEDEPGQESLVLGSKGVSLRDAIRTTQFWLISALFFCAFFPLGIMTVHIVPHATDLGISPIVAANIVAVIGGATIGGEFGIGMASDRIGNKLALIIGFVFLLAASLFLLFAPGELWMFYVVAILYGFGSGSLLVLLSPVVAEFFGLTALGIILAMVQLTAVTGEIIGSLLGGHIFDITSSYQPVFLIYAILGITGLVLAKLLSPIGRGGEANEPRRSA